MGHGVSSGQGLISLARETPGGLSIHSLLVATEVLLFLWVSDIVFEGVLVEGALLEMMVNLRLQVQERIPGRGHSIGKGLETRTAMRFRATISVWYIAGELGQRARQDGRTGKV